MSIAQFTLWGRECQWLIACAIQKSGLLTPYFKSGRILLKGSSTISCLTTLLANTPMRICGRITKNGMKTALHTGSGAHVFLYEQGKPKNVDQCLEDTIRTLGAEDLFITGANAIDADGHAALLIGSQGGGAYGTCMPFLYTEGIRTLVLSSVMKLVPGNLTTVCSDVRRDRCDFSYGMACSLVPVPGRVITEIQAIEMFAQVKAQVFAKGGFLGAEASVAIQVEGVQEEVEKVLALVARIKALPYNTGIEPASMEKCSFPCRSCQNHRACIYANKQSILRASFSKIDSKIPERNNLP